MLCLPKENSAAFKKALKDGDLKIPELLAMTTEQRTTAIGKIVGDEYAQPVNTMFENKLLLKNQQAGLIDWIKTVGGLKPEVRTDLIARIQKREKAFTAADETKFLNDVADATLGTSVSHEEAKQIFELTKKVEAAKAYTGVNDLESLVASFEKLDPKDLTAEQKTAIKDLRTKLETEKAAKEKEIENKQAEKQKISDRLKEEKQRVRDEKNVELKRIREEKKIELEKAKAKAQDERVKAKAERDDAREKARLQKENDKLEAQDRKTDQQLEEQIKRDIEKRDAEIAAKEFKEQEAIRKSQEAEEARLEREIAKEDARLERQERVDQERFDREQEQMAKSEQKTALEKATGESLKRLKQTFNKITNQKFKSIEQFSPAMQAQLNDIVEKRQAISEGQDRLIYGRAKVELENYVNSLTEKSQMEMFKEAPVRYIAGLAKSLKATLDDSVLGRQGLKTLFTNPTKWGPNAAKTFVDIYKTFGGKKVMDEIRADIVSRPNYDLYKDMKLAVNVREEQHPTSLIEHIPYLGRIAAASENAFAGFMLRMRADLADMYIDIYKNNGMDLTDKTQLESLGKLINSQTSRGALGRAEAAADIANTAFFSIRKLKADIDTLTLHAFDKGFSKTARKYAAYNLIKIIGGISLVLTIAKAFNPNSVETDPRSADFGKIKVGDTRFDVTGGMGSLAVLASRIAPAFWGGQMMSKSSVTGNVSQINGPQFGATTGGEVIGDFFANKESPILALLHHIINQKDQQGNPITVAGEMNNLFTPLPISNAVEVAQNPHSANFIATVLADSLGIGTNTYSPTMKQQHSAQITDSVKKNYEIKQSGGQTKSASTIAKEIYGSGFDSKQEAAVQKEMDFYATFGENNKTANEIHDAKQASDVIDILDKAKQEMSPADFRKFYDKATDGLISQAMQKKWETFEETGTITGGDTNLDGSQSDRKVIDIITSFAEAVHASPMEAFKLLLQNQSIRRTDNGQIIINRNTNFFDTKVGQSGYSESVKKARDASTDQKLDHVIPVEGGGLEKGGDASNLQLISTADWKRNSPVENFVGQALRDKKITGDQLREYIIRYKAGQGEPLSPELQDEYQKKYAGVPLSFAEIKQLAK